MIEAPVLLAYSPLIVSAVGQTLKVRMPDAEGTNPVTPKISTDDVHMIESEVVKPVHETVTAEDFCPKLIKLVGITSAR